MYELKKNGKVFRSKYVGTRPLSYEKRIYRAAVSQSLRNTDLNQIWFSNNIKIRKIVLCVISMSQELIETSLLIHSCT